MTGEFPTQRASNAENVSIWWRHHGNQPAQDDIITCIHISHYWPCLWAMHRSPVDPPTTVMRINQVSLNKLPDSKVHGAHLGPTGPRWARCWPHEIWNTAKLSVIWDAKMIMPWWRHQMETFSAYLAFCAGNSPVPVNSPHKGQWRGNLMFSLICVWINGWVNNREAGWGAIAVIMTSL